MLNYPKAEDKLLECLAEQSVTSWCKSRETQSASRKPLIDLLRAPTTHFTTYLVVLRAIMEETGQMTADYPPIFETVSMVEQTYSPILQQAEQERLRIRKDTAFSCRIDRAMEFNSKSQKLQMGSHFVVIKGKRDLLKASFVQYEDFKRLFESLKQEVPKEKLPVFPKSGGDLKPGSKLAKELENFVTHLLNDNLYMETNPKFMAFMNTGRDISKDVKI